MEAVPIRGCGSSSCNAWREVEVLGEGAVHQVWSGQRRLGYTTEALGGAIPERRECYIKVVGLWCL